MTYNEFLAKKLGEVLAFNRIGTETLEKGRVALALALGEEKIIEMEEKNALHGESIIRLATDAAVIDATLLKASATEEKLRKMRDLYVGEQWSNSTELMEWSGFFEGAAVVHWALVRGAAEGLNDESLLALSQEGIDWHRELIDLAESELGTIGQDKVSL